MPSGKPGTKKLKITNHEGSVISGDCVYSMGLKGDEVPGVQASNLDSNTKSNRNFGAAKADQYNEYYTQYCDIETEVGQICKSIPGYFSDKVVYLNCDDPLKSNFWKFFHREFDELGLKKLIASHWDHDRPVEKWEFEGAGGDCEIRKIPLEFNGSYDSPELHVAMKEADVIMTNPPFSDYSRYINYLIDWKKDFSVIAPLNALHYKAIRPLILSGEVMLGYGAKFRFIVPEGAEAKKHDRFDKSGNRIRRVPSVVLTNVPYLDRTAIPIIKLTKSYVGNENEYPAYDNYPQAINVNDIRLIPKDWDGLMGVPLTFLLRWNTDQFDLIAFDDDLETTNGKGLSVSGKNKYSRLIIKRK